jgi:phenylpyruvate tautomerase PptA (4-oxalocrotonate tautomerase family)
MPYLHFDLPRRYPAEVKRALAARLGELYAEIMQTSPGIVKVGFRELGAENLFRCGAPDGGVEPVIVGQCDIRRGRPTEQRARLAAAIVEACAEAFGVDGAAIELEFTQHSGDEMYRRGAFAGDWTPCEAGGSGRGRDEGREARGEGGRTRIRQSPRGRPGGA